MIFRYENTICDIDLSLIKNERVPFFVLEKILKGVCTLTITDKNDFIICYSCEPHPVWIWTKDDASNETLDKVLEILATEFGFNSKYQFNSKASFFEYAKSKGYDIKAHLNLLSYACPLPILPKKQPKGDFILPAESDIDIAGNMIYDFQKSVGITSLPKEKCLEKAKNLIAQKRLFFIVNKGDIAAMCAYNPLDDIASINCVYTSPSYRKLGYGAMIVYLVTRLVISEGYLPVLYADGGYIASNKCYQGIGYIQSGEIITFQ